MTSQRRPRANCPICSSGRAPEINRLKNVDGLGYRRISKQTEFTGQAVRDHFSQCETPPFKTEITDSLGSSEGKHLELEGDTGVLNVSGLTEKVSDYSFLLEKFNLDPQVYEVIEPVRMSTWQSGDRDLYSYRARIQKRTVATEQTLDIEGWRKVLRSSRKVRRTEGGGLLSTAIWPGDQQIGKKGTAQALDNWTAGVVAYVEDTKARMYAGEKFNSVLVGLGGDIAEGIANSYRNQAFAAELNLSTQIEVAYDTELWMFKYIIDELGLPIDASVIISNHGETWVREGGKDPITSRGDNIDTHIARLVKKTFENIPGYGDVINWNIADGNVANVFVHNGVKFYHSHNYIEKGAGAGVEAKTVSAMQRQILSDPLELGDVQVFMTHHYHHLWMKQEGVYTVFGAPAIEAEKSSEWLKDMNGVWSKPGILGMTINPHSAMGWQDLRVY